MQVKANYNIKSLRIVNFILKIRGTAISKNVVIYISMHLCLALYESL